MSLSLIRFRWRWVIAYTHLQLKNKFSQLLWNLKYFVILHSLYHISLCILCSIYCFFCQSGKCEEILYVVSKCISLIANASRYLSMCLFLINVFPFMKFLLIFLHYFPISMLFFVYSKEIFIYSGYYYFVSFVRNISSQVLFLFFPVPVVSFDKDTFILT